MEQNKTVKCAQRQASKYSAELRWPSTPLPGCVDRLPAASGPAGHRKQEETGASQLTASHLTRCLDSAPHFTVLGCGYNQDCYFLFLFFQILLIDWHGAPLRPAVGQCEWTCFFEVIWCRLIREWHHRTVLHGHRRRPRETKAAVRDRHRHQVQVATIQWPWGPLLIDPDKLSCQWDEWIVNICHPIFWRLAPVEKKTKKILNFLKIN